MMPATDRYVADRLRCNSCPTNLLQTKKRKFTYDDAEDMLQASSTELARGLRDRRVLTIQGLFLSLPSSRLKFTSPPSDELRPIAPSHLTTILELLLNYLVSLSQPHHAADVENLAAALEDDHEVKRDVSRQVMGWFGEVKGGKWAMDVNATVKEVGVGILRAYKVRAYNHWSGMSLANVHGSL